MASIVLMVLVTASVFFFSWMGAGVVSGAVARLKERYVIRSLSDLRDFLLFVDAKAIAILGLCTCPLLGGAGFLVGGGITAALSGVAGLAGPWVVVRQHRARRLRLFDRQLVDALQALANAFRAGLTYSQALESLAKEAPFPLGQELELVVKELKLGVPLERALENLAARVASDDLSLVVVATNTARKLGGNMAEMFETVAGTIRERFRLQGKIAALTSQGKMQGWIVAALPLLLGIVLRYMRPDLVDPMLDHIFGWALVAVVVILEAVGIFFIRRIVNVDV